MSRSTRPSLHSSHIALNSLTYLLKRLTSSKCLLLKQSPFRIDACCVVVAPSPWHIHWEWVSARLLTYMGYMLISGKHSWRSAGCYRSCSVTPSKWANTLYKYVHRQRYGRGWCFRQRSMIIGTKIYNGVTAAYTTVWDDPIVFRKASRDAASDWDQYRHEDTIYVIRY